jgi:hypothetical protein
LTDPLTGRELIQKSYDYLDKLTKECAKYLIEDYNKSHRKFQLGRVAADVSADVVQWFEKRDRNVRLSLEPNSVIRPQPTLVRFRFKGSTKDADFMLDASVGVFVTPGSEISDSTVAFPKTLVISGERTTFTKRKI